MWFLNAECPFIMIYSCSLPSFRDFLQSGCFSLKKKKKKKALNYFRGNQVSEHPQEEEDEGNLQQFHIQTEVPFPRIQIRHVPTRELFPNSKQQPPTATDRHQLFALQIPEELTSNHHLVLQLLALASGMLLITGADLIYICLLISPSI